MWIQIHFKNAFKQLAQKVTHWWPDRITDTEELKYVNMYIYVPAVWITYTRH